MKKNILLFLFLSIGAVARPALPIIQISFPTVDIQRVSKGSDQYDVQNDERCVRTIPVSDIRYLGDLKIITNDYNRYFFTYQDSNECWYRVCVNLEDASVVAVGAFDGIRKVVCVEPVSNRCYQLRTAPRGCEWFPDEFHMPGAELSEEDAALLSEVFGP